MSEFKVKNIEQVLNEENRIITSTSGTSMFPMLRDKRDMVVINKPLKPLIKTDVALYRLSSEKLIMHRVIAVKNDYYIIRGDNLCKKEIVPKDSVIGVLDSFYRDGKYINCKNNKKYKIYVFFIMHSFAFRFFYKRFVIPTGHKIKSFLRATK